MSENTTRPTSYKVGDFVTPDPHAGFPAHVLGVVYKVVKVPVGARGVNYTCERADGVQGRGIRGSVDALLPADPNAPKKSAYDVLVESYEKTPPVGTVITIHGVANIKSHHLYVVTADSRKPGGVRASKLGGGDGTRYWPFIPLSKIKIVPVDQIAAHLAAQR